MQDNKNESINLIDALREFRETEKIFQPLALNVAQNILDQNHSALELTKLYANKMADLAIKCKNIQALYIVNEDSYSQQLQDLQIEGYKRIAIIVDDAIYLAKYGKNITPNGKN